MKKIYTKSRNFFAKNFKSIPKTEKLAGYFDRISEYGRLEGWALDKTNLADFVTVYVFINNVCIASTIANLHRGDLVAAKVKSDGKAGFSITLELGKNTLPLLKPGARIDVAFDEHNQQRLKGSGKLLDKQDVDNILLANVSLSVPLKAYLDSVVAACQHPDESNDCKHEIIMVLRAAYHLCRMECYEQLLKFLNQINNPTVLRFLELEFTLFRVMALTETDLLNERIVELLDTAFYERFSDKEARQRSLHFTVYINATFLAFCNLLQTKVAQFVQKPEQNLVLLGKLAWLLSLWLYRLYANPEIALKFMLLLQTVDPEFLCKLESQQHLAHLYCESGDNLAALPHCLNAIRQHTDYWWIYHEAAVILGKISNQQRLLFKSNLPVIEAYFHQAVELNPYQSKSLRELEQVLNNYFSCSRLLTWQLAEAGFVDEALAERNEDIQLLIQTISRIYSGRFHQLDYIETKHRACQNPVANKVLFVGSRDLFQCYHYRVQQKLEQAKRQNLVTDYLDITELTQRNWQRLLLDVAVLYACRIPATIPEIKLLCYAKGLGITIIYDIDDLIFDATAFPAALETYAGTIDETTHLHLKMDNPFFLNALKFADVCVASTPTLALEIARQVNANVPVIVHPNVLPYDLYHLAQAEQRAARTSRQTQVTIVYGSATKAHKQSFYQIFLPAVLTVLKKMSQVKLVLIGHFVGIPVEFKKQIRILEPCADFMEYINLLKTADISVAILEQSRLTDTKSEIKWLEAAALSIPSIVTPTKAYRDVLTDGENVLFAATSAQWQEQLLRLVEDAALRESIGSAAKKLAFEKFSPQIGEQILKDTVARFIFDKTILTKAKKRLLLVNTYFYPQSIGGATRVFENQVRGLLARYSDDYEVFVLTCEADPDSDKAYFVEQYWFDRALVTKLNIPAKDWAEYEDSQIYEFCQDFYKKYAFEVIHFHSVQILTASAVNAALALKIPYIITLHDGWWLSIYQFLVNPAGKLLDHTQLLAGAPENPVQAEWIIKRRQELRRLMSKANKVVAVSEKFAKLYQEAGVDNVQVHENYVEIFSRFEPQPRQSDKTVLGFVGGISTHKGYDLLKTALEKGHFANMQLIVINHSLQSGEVYRSKWGETWVEFRAKARQSEMAKLYAQFDVLIAPSIWPESYGLVTREALQAGLWVIASDCGAIGDCIVEGVNGNIVNVEDSSSLMNALERLPEKLKNRNSNETPQTPAKLCFGETMEGHLQKLVNMYQLISGTEN